MKDAPKSNGYLTFPIQMNAYTRPQKCAYESTSSRWILNGPNNSYFQLLKDCYYGSHTNKVVIDSYVDYIYGKGLFSNGEPIKKYISNREVKQFIKDFYMNGQAALQVIYNLDREIVELSYVRMECIGIDKQEIITSPSAYWFCRDWENTGQNTPIEIPAFGRSKELTELLVVRNNDNSEFFSLPDYEPCLEYCQWQQTFSHWNLKFAQNGMSLGYIVNIIKGLEDNIEDQDMLIEKIKRNWTGAENAGSIQVCFADNPEMKTTIEAIPDNNSSDKFEFMTAYAKEVILDSHGVPNGILFNVKDGTGFSNNADEMETALKTLYRSRINPIREQIIDGLERVFEVIQPGTELMFKDFDELSLEEKTTTEVTVENKNNEI